MGTGTVITNLSHYSSRFHSSSEEVGSETVVYHELSVKETEEQDPELPVQASYLILYICNLLLQKKQNTGLEISYG